MCYLFLYLFIYFETKLGKVSVSVEWRLTWDSSCYLKHQLSEREKTNKKLNLMPFEVSRSLEEVVVKVGLCSPTKASPFLNGAI